MQYLPKHHNCLPVRHKNIRHIIWLSEFLFAGPFMLPKIDLMNYMWVNQGFCTSNCQFPLSACVTKSAVLGCDGPKIAWFELPIARWSYKEVMKWNCSSFVNLLFMFLCMVRFSDPVFLTHNLAIWNFRYKEKLKIHVHV